MGSIGDLLPKWDLDERTVRERMDRAPTPRERERWHALWLLGQGWSEARVAAALERAPHTIGLWATTLRDAGPSGLAFEQAGGSPPPSTRTPGPS